MKDDTFEALCELEFFDAQSGTTVTTRLGPPTFDPIENLFFCLSEVTGAEDGQVERVRGVDPFQAISVSQQRFRIIFKHLSGDFRSAQTGDSAHTVFPTEIPWVYGSDVYQRLCKMVDDEVQKIEDELTRRRESRTQQDDE